MDQLLRVLRGLRFRLTLSHSIFFALLLAFIGMAFREYLRIEDQGEARLALEDGWDTAKAYLRVSGGVPQWEEYPNDPEKQAAVLRLRSMHILIDEQGTVLSVSGAYATIPVPSLDEIHRILTSDQPQTFLKEGALGIPYMVRAGRIRGVIAGKPYYFAIARSMELNARTLKIFTTNYFAALPFLVTFTAIMGWWVAGRILQPLNAVAHVADTITGANLSLQIPLRGADDELDHMIQNFNQMTVRLHESFNQVRRFSTDASHELRTPLTAIRGQLEVALMTAQTTTQYHEAVAKALEDVEGLSRMVDVLLQLAQAEGGQWVLDRVRLRMSSVVTTVADQFQPLAEEKNLTVTNRVPSTLAIVGDRVQIERLVANLLSNAIKYTPPGGKVDISAEEVGHEVCLSVADTGPGISKEDLPHVFERFYRVRKNQNSSAKGLGLGLSFVAVIAKAHEGRAEVESTPGQGTCFKIYLPGAPAARPDHLRS